MPYAHRFGLLWTVVVLELFAGGCRPVRLNDPVEGEVVYAAYVRARDADHQDVNLTFYVNSL